MRYAIIENNVVTNVAEYDEGEAPNHAVATEIAGIGDGFSAGEFIEKTVPPKTTEQLNAPILFKLAQIDQKKIRALTDAINGDHLRLQNLEAEAVTLRGQLL